MKKVLVATLTVVILSMIYISNIISVNASDPYIYYFSDNLNASSTVSQIIYDLSLNNSDIAWFNWSTNFYASYTSYYYDFYNIEDSYIIFEIDEDFTKFNTYSGQPFPDELYDTFYTLKNNDNYIMFISGVDEMKYESHNDFLDEVDFHIIKDTYNVFVESSFYWLEYYFGSSPSGVDLILNNDLYFNNYQSFRNYYLLPYINTRYYSYFTTCTQAEALDENSINIYIQNDNAVDYTLINSGQLGHINISTANLNGYIYAIGASNQNTLDSGEWLGVIDRLMPFMLCYYNLYSYSYSFNYPISHMYTYNPNSVNNPSLLDMIETFLTNVAICYQYDNWTGRCNITHIMLEVVPGGWMVNYNDVNFYNCWDIYKREDLTLGIDDFDYDDGSLF